MAQYVVVLFETGLEIFPRQKNSFHGPVHTSPTLIIVSALTRMEVDYGLMLNAERARKLAPVLDAFFSTIATLSFDEADAQAAAGIRAALRAKGQPIGAYDVLIAGTGLARGLAVVTSNVGEFKRVSGLKVENWR